MFGAVALVNLKSLETGDSIIKYLWGITLLVIVGIIAKFDILGVIIPNGQLLNWNFVIVLLILLVVITNYIIYKIMLKFLKTEHEEHEITKREHEITKKERDNLNILLGDSEKLRLTDVITGIPNSDKLEKDINEKFSKADNDFQLIIIDLKNFREINNKFGEFKTDNLLRRIAQTIYQKMRRNEEMYRKNKETNVCPNDCLKSNMYRLYTGGDNFIFIIYGDQSEAIGFANRLVGIFKQIPTSDILGADILLSFYCAIVKVHKGDKFEDVKKRFSDCLKIARQEKDKADFTIYWSPNDIEGSLTDKRKLSEYDRARDLFHVMSLIEK